jgi:hypothetical protein
MAVLLRVCLTVCLYLLVNVAVPTQGFDVTTICKQCQGLFSKSVSALLPQLTHYLRGGSILDPLFNVTTQFLRCAQEIKCLPVNDYLLGFVIDVLEDRKSLISVIRRSFDCLTTLEMQAAGTRCVSGVIVTRMSVALSALLTGSSSTLNENDFVCRETAYAYNCLQNITLCGSDPSVGQMLAKSFHLLLKSSLISQLTLQMNCSFVDE